MKRILALSGIVLAASNAMALTLLTSRAQITEQAYIDWGQVGADGVYVASPHVVQTSLDVFNAKVTTKTNMARYTEGISALGNFAIGDNLLHGGFDGGAMTIRLAKTVSDFGTQFQRNAYGAFQVKITAFDGLDNSLGSFIVNGNAGGNQNNSAVFAGVHSAISDILSVKMEMVDGSDFLINKVSLNGCSPVPEPASMSALALGVAGLIRRKMKKS
ncbi:MAG: PEP-CTERM sorting domain-containing protein [Armatimonadetes bacterium]|nr:PEP-CTERM sorting domain-containing protein [Armatimonadota bacterium]